MTNTMFINNFKFQIGKKCCVLSASEKCQQFLPWNNIAWMLGLLRKPIIIIGSSPTL